MNVLLISDAFPPEVRSSSHLMFELSEELAGRGHRVSVLTTFPRYNLTDRHQAETGRLFRREKLNRLEVARVYSLPIHNVRPVMRGIGHLQLGLGFGLAGLLTQRPDAVICYSPPLLLGLSSRLVAGWNEAAFVFNVQDLFPQNAIDLGILRNLTLITLFRRVEKYIYRRAHAITVHSPANRSFLLAQGVPPGKVRVINNWVDTDLHRPADRQNHLRTRFNLGKKFVALFAGVLGYAQDISVILDAATQLRDDPEILFLVVGDGMEREALQQGIRGRGLTNVRWDNFVAREEYPTLVAASDVGLVTLKAMMKTPVVPSKIQGLMACGRPIIATLNSESDAHAILREAGCGMAFSAGDAVELANALRSLKADQALCRRMGANARAYALAHFSKAVCVDQYESLLYELKSNTSRAGG